MADTDGSVLVRIAGGLIQTPNGPHPGDLLIADGRVEAVLDRDVEVTGAETVDADGLWVLPGLVDLHAHTRVPGYEYKEDYATASRAAAAGGVTTFVDMPNVEPPTTTVELFEDK